MIKDTIYRQAAIDLINQHIFYNDYDDTDKCSLVDGLRELPPAQPAERCIAKIQFDEGKMKEIVDKAITRCKDCKHYEIWQLKSDYTDDKRFKPSVCVLGCYAVHRPEDWYCADAERRTDEDR